jgi:hypothetical protein
LTSNTSPGAPTTLITLHSFQPVLFGLAFWKPLNKITKDQA